MVLDKVSTGRGEGVGNLRSVVDSSPKIAKLTERSMSAAGMLDDLPRALAVACSRPYRLQNSLARFSASAAEMCASGCRCRSRSRAICVAAPIVLHGLVSAGVVSWYVARRTRH